MNSTVRPPQVGDVYHVKSTPDDDRGYTVRIIKVIGDVCAWKFSPDLTHPHGWGPGDQDISGAIGAIAAGTWKLSKQSVVNEFYS